MYHYKSITVVSMYSAHSVTFSFCTEQGHCGACRRKWRLTGTDLARPKRCSTVLNPLSWQNWMAAYLDYTLQMKNAVLWLTSYGSWHSYEKKKKLYFRCCSNEWLVRNDYHINTHYADHSEIVSSSFVMCPDGFRSQIGCLDGNWACVSWTIIGQPGNSIFVCRV